MGTDLRLLLDEAIQDDVAREIINSSSAIKCKCVRELTELVSKTDKDVMDYAQKDGRIVVVLPSKLDSQGLGI